MPIVKRQYRRIVVNVVFEWSEESANAGWLVDEIDELPWERYDYIDQSDIDRECEPEI